MEQFWATYSERYMASDLDPVAVEAYRDAGAAEAAIVDLRIVQLDSASCLATVCWSARSADGAVLRAFTVSYQMLRCLGEWTILSYTYHAD
jgi:hypothetical protein